MLVPHQLLSKYQSCNYPQHVSVIPYLNQDETYKYLHRENTFLIIVTTKDNYHQNKINAKISPHCTLLVDTNG